MNNNKVFDNEALRQQFYHLIMTTGFSNILGASFYELLLFVLLILFLWCNLIDIIKMLTLIITSSTLSIFKGLLNKYLHSFPPM